MGIYKQKDDRIEVNILGLILACLLYSIVIATVIVSLEFTKAKPEFMTIAKENPEVILAVWGFIVILFTVISSIGSMLYASMVADKVNFFRRR